MEFKSCEKRQSVIDTTKNTLVIGGPGSGKTTLALQKCKKHIETLMSGEHILFLSFSRSAVQQIVNRSRENLTEEDVQSIDVQTYHSFCWKFLHSHGALLGGRSLKMLKLSEESVRRSQFMGDWEDEKKRLKEEEGLVSFDLFASTAAELLEGSTHLRVWLGKLYPLIILDEFQDSDDEQWRLVKQFSQVTKLLILADIDQRIFDTSFRPGVKADRLKILKNEIELDELNLGSDNFRSTESDILSFGNSVLSGVNTISKFKSIKSVTFANEKQLALAVHFAVIVILKDLGELGVDDPTVAVLTRSNDFVARISDALDKPHRTITQVLRPVPHRVVWDQEITAAAGVVIAAAMEFKSHNNQYSRINFHAKIEEYYLIKKDYCNRYGGRGTKAYSDRANRFKRSKCKIILDKKLGKGSPFQLEESLMGVTELTGDPVRDWKIVRSAFEIHSDFKSILKDSKMVRLFRASHTLANEMGNAWMKNGAYEGASKVVRKVLDRERLVELNRQQSGVSVMTMHKSKGKEFDGVVIVEGEHSSNFFQEFEAPNYNGSRRLLRVAITRARKLVILVRPTNSQNLFISNEVA